VRLVRRRLIVAAVMLGAGLAAWPWLGLGVYALRLYAMPAPDALAMPVQGLPRTALHDTWHAARAPARQHEGIDIFAKKGTPVLASTEGIVLRIGESALGGQVVWVFGPGGQHHYYAHLDQPSHASWGQRVQPGSVLGYVGNTGNARTTPPHLHYGVYAASGAINPYPILAQAFRQAR
jgi:murein DD-endopeptidase MepM/ murein hydrolase activator NlpD